MNSTLLFLAGKFVFGKCNGRLPVFCDVLHRLRKKYRLNLKNDMPPQDKFNAIITSLKALAEGYCSKNYVRKFLRALHPKWRAKVTTIEESKDLTPLSLNELIGNLKVYEMIIKKDTKRVKAKGERRSLALKDKKNLVMKNVRLSRVKMKNTPWRLETLRSSSREEEGSECLKPPNDKNQRAFFGGSWSDSGEEDDEKAKDETCLIAQASSEICLGIDLEPDEWINDSECSKRMTRNRKLFSTYKAYNKGNVVFGSILRGNIIGKGQICDNKCKIIFSKHDSEITKDGKVIRRGHKNMRLIQSLASKELVRNLPKLKFDQHSCDACKIGKQAHTSHKAKNIVSTTRFLELLHIDLFGQSAIRSYRGNLYTLVIVDDYSRKTPYKLLRGRKPNLDYFKVFGSKCFIINTKDYLPKFDPKSYECVFLGYFQNSKAYIYLNKHTMKIEESLNMRFDETPPPSKTSPLVDDDLDEEEAIKKNLENDNFRS
nr:hypothetical protein [Tanacetum cinerariifolium]